MQSKFHKIFTVGTTAVMLLSSIAVFPAFGVSAENVMTADDITQNMTIGWNIGNSLDATGYDSSQETSWGNPTVTRELIDAVKAKGFNTIRIPTTWYPNVTTTTDENGKPVYTISELWAATCAGSSGLRIRAGYVCHSESAPRGVDQSFRLPHCL